MKYFNFKLLTFFFALALAIPPAWATTDVITASDLAATSTTYTVTSTPVVKGSGAAYLAKSALKSNAIAISSNSEGFVATSASGGTAKSITISFSTAQSGTKSIQVYGKSAAYNTTDVYYSASTRGTLITTISSYSQNGSQVSLTGDYPFIAIRCSSGEAIIDQIEIEWEGGTSITITPETQTINDAAAGALTITGNGVDGNINASLATNTDWYLNPSTFSSAGGEASISYTGRALSASNTVTATAANDATVTASATVNYLADLWILTDNGVQDQWDYSNGTPMTYNNGTYTANFTANVNNTFILFARKLGESNPWNTRYVFGPSSNGDWWLTGDNGSGTIDLNDDDPIKIVNAGTYTITINANTGAFTIEKYVETVATPTFSPEDGATFTDTQSVSISCATDGATIYYTTDGSTPTSASTQYTGAITLTATTTIKAIAVKSGWNDSEVATATYTFVEPSNDVTICDEGDTNDYLPIYGFYYDALQVNQMIYPASKLSDLQDKLITSMTFYTTNEYFSGGQYKVAVGTTTQSEFSSPVTRITGLTDVATQQVAVAGATELTVTFDEPFEYTGGNLVVDFEVTTEGTYGGSRTYFAGENQGTNTSFHSYGSSLSSNGVYSTNYLRQFLPKVTFAVEDASSIPTVTVAPASLAFGDVVLNNTAPAQTVTLTNTSDVEFTPVLTFSDGFSTTVTPTQLSENGTLQIPVTFTPTQLGAYNGTLIISDGNGHDLATVTLTGTGIEQQLDYNVTVNPDGGTIDFGTVVYNEGSSTRNITVTNTGLNAITPTLSALTAPYSTDYTAAALASGESVTITITFAPTEEGTFTDNATLTFGRGTEARNFTLTGKGGIYDANDHSELYDYEYTWIDDDNVEHTSNLLETATDPNQIIAMLREVYTNKAIPGNKKRGYTREGAVENWRVSYPAVGQLTRTYTSGSGYSYDYTDAYGWNIPTEKPILNTTLGSYNYYYLDPTEYEPIEEGVTLIMIELKDLTNFSGNSNYYSISSNSLSLKEKIANAFKSARIIKDFKQSGTGEEAGTLFKIDADKLNRFFLIAKGQLRLIDHTYNNFQDGYTFSEPSYRIRNNSSSGTYTDTYFTEAVMYPFIHMFEQFSPNVASTASSAQTDEYQKLINMESFYVIHDCPSAAFIAGNHEFNMYGLDSESDDCQDVRDMMFFVPEYRMKDWGEQYAVTEKRDFSSEKFVNYHQSHQPKMGLYVIRQNEITGEQQANAEVYDLNLSWESNLLDFLPGDEAEYDLYRVVIDPNTGEKTYEFVATIPSGQTTYVDHVAMEENGQVVTYVVQGQDTDHFLSLQLSNEESFIIPGTDKTSLIGLAPNGYHYSRFEPETETNYYANQLKINRLATYVKGDYLGSGAKFTFKRSIDGGTNWTTIAEAVSNGSGTLTVTMQNQRADGQYTHNSVDWIKMQNPASVTYTVDANGYANLTNLSLFDNIAQSVIGNTHPNRYTYKIELEASRNLDDTDTNVAHSNTISYMIHKTDMNIEGYTLAQVDADTQHTLDADVERTLDEQVKYSSKQEILRYDVYRWKDDAEKLILDFSESSFVPTWNNVTVDEMDVAPTGQAGNQGDEYTIKIDGVNKGSVAISSGETKYVNYADTMAVKNAGLYTYAPVVETFTLPREDYNTYGAPLQQTAVSKVGVEVGAYSINLISASGKEPAVWEENDKKYCHYTVKLNLTPINVPEGYDLYMVRAWRQVDRSLLNEQVWPKNPERNRDYRLTENGEYMMEQVDYAIFDKNTTPSDYKLGQSDIEQGTPSVEEVRATFGAQKLRTEADETGVIESLPMHFIVRAYYTRNANLTAGNAANGAPRRDAAANAAADGKYYIAEAACDFTFYASDVNEEHTGLASVTVDRVLTGVTYYNMMGLSSTTLFEGMNIVVKRFSDGTTSTAKVIK